MIKTIKNCYNITELSSLSQEQPLSAHEQLKVKLHLLICPACRAFDQNNRTLKQIIQRHKQIDDDSQLLPP